MLRASDTAEERATFQQLRYRFPDGRIMRRFDVLWLHSCGTFAPEIATLVQQNAYTVRDVIKDFNRGGVELVMTIDSNHPTSDLEQHRISIIEEFTLRPPASSKEAAARIEKRTGVKRSEQRVRIFMKNIGMKFRKTAAISAKADWEKQEDFKKRFGA